MLARGTGNAARDTTTGTQADPDTRTPEEREATAQRLIASFVSHARDRMVQGDRTDRANALGNYLAAHRSALPGVRWLENDTALMLRLAPASGLFSGELTAATLQPGHRRLLANALVLALTRSIDWRAELKVPRSDGGVFHDGITLRNATTLSIGAAVSALDDRIRHVLEAVHIPEDYAPLVSQLRTALISDPTLSFHSVPPSMRYGSREWIQLWTGIEACGAAGMDADALSFEEVMAMGHAVGMQAAQADDQGQAQDAPHALLPVSHAGLMFMAHAAGKVDLAHLKPEHDAEATKQIQAFAKEVFKSEIALSEATSRLVALQNAPTGRSIAEGVLKAKGLDPAARVIEEPIHFKGKRISYKLLDFYVKFNDLAKIEPNQFNNELIAKVGKDTPRYSDLYDRTLDTYISDYIGAHKTTMRVVLEAAKKDGFDQNAGSASINTERIVVRSHKDIHAHGFFVNCMDDGEVYRYFVSFSGVIERIPNSISHTAWVTLNRHAVFAADDLKKIGTEQALRDDFLWSTERHLYAPKASGIYDAIDADLRPRLVKYKEQSKPAQDGASRADRLVESFIPVYGTYASWKRGEYFSAGLSGIFDVFAVIPILGESVKLVAVSEGALMRGVTSAIAMSRERGIVKGLLYGLGKTVEELPHIGVQAVHTMGTMLDSIVPIPIGTHSFAEMLTGAYGFLRSGNLRKIVKNLRARFPRLSLQLRARTQPRNSFYTQFSLYPWQTGPLHGTAGQNAAQARFLKVLDQDGGSQWLRRFGGNYARFDPIRLQPTGPVLIRAKDGRLLPSLSVDELTRHAVTDSAMLEKLRRAQAAGDGTIALDGKRYASISGSYVEIVQVEAAAAGQPARWHAAGGVQADSAAINATPLIHDAAQGVWVAAAHHAEETHALAAILDRWTIPNRPGALNKAVAIDRLRADALKAYGQKYAEYLESQGPAVLRGLLTTDDAMEASRILLGDGRFMHAMITTADVAEAARIVDVLDMLRSGALPMGNRLAGSAERRANISHYFDTVLQQLGKKDTQELHDTIAAYGERAAALMRHAGTGNAAQRQRADEIADVLAVLQQKLSIRRGDGAIDDAIARAAVTLTSDERRVLEPLGLVPKAIPPATVTELASELQKVDAAFDKAVQDATTKAGGKPGAAELATLYEAGRAAALTRLGVSITKLQPASSEEARLLYRALLEDKTLSVNGKSPAAFAGKYAIAADDVAARIYARRGTPAKPGRHYPSADTPLQGLGRDEASTYRVQRPHDTVLLAGDLPLYRQAEGSGIYIMQGGDWFQVRWDADNATWRIIQRDKPTAQGIAIRRGDKGWEVQHNVGMPGGAPTVHREIDWEAARALDADTPDGLVSGPGMYFDSAGVAHYAQGRISQSETVARAAHVLESTTDVTPHVAWNDAFAEYFDIALDMGAGPKKVIPTVRDLYNDLSREEEYYDYIKDFFVKLTESETFVGLLNRAIADGKIGTQPEKKWTLTALFPAAMEHGGTGAGHLGVNHDEMSISVPYLVGNYPTTPVYLSKGGRFQAVTPQRAMTRHLVQMLTNERPPVQGPWLRNGTVDVGALPTLGLGERGAIDALVERIMRETGSPLPPLLSHLPFHASHGATGATPVLAHGRDAGIVDFQPSPGLTQAIQDAGGVSRLEDYVRLQDEYLDGVFPPSRVDTPPRNQDAVVTPPDRTRNGDVDRTDPVPAPVPIPAPARPTIALSPDADLMTRFYDELVSHMKGVGTREQAASIKAYLRRMEADAEGGAILRAMAAYYDIMGDVPRISLRPGLTEVEVKQPTWWRRHTRWRVDSTIFQDEDLFMATYALRGIYKDMAKMHGPWFEGVCSKAISKGKIRLDPALEKSWQAWIDDDTVPAAFAHARDEHLATRRAKRAQIVKEVRTKLQKARFYGGIDEDTFRWALDSRGKYPAERSHLDLERNHLSTGMPPLPDDIQSLRLMTDQHSILDKIPSKVERLTIFGDGGTESPAITFPAIPDTVRHLIVRNQNMTGLPARLAGGKLHTVELSNCGLDRLPILGSGVKVVKVPYNRLTELPSPLPDAMEVLEANYNQLRTLPDLPPRIQHIDVSMNQLTALPRVIPDTVRELDASNNQLTELPRTLALLRARLIDLRDNPLLEGQIERLEQLILQPDGRSRSTVLSGARAPRPANDLSSAVKGILGGTHPEALARWQAIEKAAAPGSDEAANLVEFGRYLAEVTGTSSYQQAAFRKEVQELIAELSKPERQTLRDAAMHICERVQRVCRDRAAWAMGELRKARLTDDILRGLYDNRVAEVIDVGRQMLAMDILTELAGEKAIEMGMRDEALEVHMAYGIQLRPKDQLDLGIMVPEMDYMGMVDLSEADLATARRVVLDRLHTDFDKFFVTRYEPWQKMLERKFGDRYKDTKSQLAEQLVGAEFDARVNARLEEYGLPLDDLAARRDAGDALASEMEYAALAPMTTEYLESTGASYRPKPPRRA
uniref:NEL-type E3 ubiquitin ligase domain-containing protein n=1 Tax=Bordetella sputigena TaxID=1416810 RepID=UPI0039F04889